MDTVTEFNVNVYAKDGWNREILRMCDDLVRRSVMECGRMYNFDGDEACKRLGLEKIRLEEVSKKVVVKKVKDVLKPRIPLPYNGEFREECCYALRQNGGLYTQCQNERKGSEYCKSCANAMQKVGGDIPEYGTIQQRNAVGIFEYVDPKGRKPVAYTKIMKKYKLTEDEVLEEARKLNIQINPEHFVVKDEAKRGRPASGNKEEKVKGPKGRPKKEKKVLEIEGEDEDLFAALVAEANSSDEVVVPKKKSSKTEEEKAAEKAEKEAKLAAEKAEKEAKKAAEKAEKEAKKAAEKAEKEAKKEEKVVEVEEEPDVVKKIVFEDKKYLKSKKTGIVYDYAEYINNQEQVVVGKWNEVTNRIDFVKEEEEDAEEEEEEYDM